MADDLQKPATDPQGDLYERDYLAWTQKQAELLRAGPAGLPYLDYLNLIEEVESLGRSEAAAASSQVENILEHFLKIQFLGPARTVPHWSKEIRAFRLALERKLTPTLRARLPEDLPNAYGVAAARAAVYASHANLKVDLPVECPYLWDQIMDPDWYPTPDYEV